MNIRGCQGDMYSYIDFHSGSTDFIPANSAEIRGNHLSVASAFSCALLCHQDPQCRTFVFDSSICQLYEGSSDTGLIVSSPSTNRLVGSINYDLVQLANTYNKSCDHCFPDRYLVCRNNTWQCPLNSFYNGQGKCLHELYPDSSMICEDDKWYRQSMNQICQCGKCQCRTGQIWFSKTCRPQFLSGISCNTSDQCRNDLNLVCSRINKTCIPMRIVRMPVISGTLPSKFSYVDESFNISGMEWWRAFDDENGTCLAQSFWFPQANSYTTFPPNYFNTSVKPLATKYALLSIERWSVYQTYLFELTFFGGLY
ncbi:unnamed protein product [Adineta ricciae]|uniref:Apple domain-containing protein n=1 Tax=Adineta ricciae TaxID=249248 RepID=A0A814SWX0_ADIRI|nr:unnamed protein product [Adineta ricciae]CAF1537354.1 unnamed protein product [Adineta ricciae]